jgi:hypothetical protein
LLPDKKIRLNFFDSLSGLAGHSSVGILTQRAPGSQSFATKKCMKINRLRSIKNIFKIALFAGNKINVKE